jgi:hypothetical protein
LTIRSKHNNLLNYFIHDKRDLSPAYVRKCKKYLDEISNKLKINRTEFEDVREESSKPQASSGKRQARKSLTPTKSLI